MSCIQRSRGVRESRRGFRLRPAPYARAFLECPPRVRRRDAAIAEWDRLVRELDHEARDDLDPEAKVDNAYSGQPRGERPWQKRTSPSLRPV